MSKIKEIIEGLVNDIVDNPGVKAEAQRRLFICLQPDEPYPHCRNYNADDKLLGPRCTGCSCILKYKSKSPDSKCPLGKWENK